MISEERLAQILNQYEAVCAEMNNPNIEPQRFTTLAKEYAELHPIAQEILRWKEIKQECDQAKALMTDPEMAPIAREEFERLTHVCQEKAQHITMMLLPKDVDDRRNVILEVRAGTGGDEAALFAADLFRMYERYGHQYHWTFEVLSLTPSEMGGLKEAIAAIKGKNVYARLKFESGIHRVQRVPLTEASGRVHTSAATVAILPEADRVDAEIKDSDLKIDVYRASGAGGQHVNTTESAIRILHVPTGLIVTQQGERSQHKNRERALAVLATKLYDLKKQKIEQERAAERKEQVGSGDRSGRIRTYNFSQGRVTDHRINLSIYALQDVLEGSSLDLIIDPLLLDAQAKKLAQFH